MARRVVVWIALLLTCAMSRASWAEPVVVEATLDRDVVSVQEEVTLQITVRGGAATEALQLPPVPGMAMRFAGTMQSVSIVNGQVSTTKTTTYLLSPQREGTFTIGPVRVRVNGREVASAPMRLEVVSAPPGGVPARGAPAPPPVRFPGMPPMPHLPGMGQLDPPMPAPEPEGRGPAFITAEVDTTTPVVGQAITYTLRFYHAAGVELSGQAQYPNTTGFITDDQQPERTYNKVVDGRRYGVNEVRLCMFPTAEGTYEIGATRLRCRVPLSSGDSDFDAILGGMTERELETNAIRVDVRPLPPGRPSDFCGGVGPLTLQASNDAPSDLRVGQPFTVTLTAKGTGNVKMVQAPRLPALSGFKASDPAVGGSGTQRRDPQAGTRTFTYVLQPTRDGTLTVPAISMSYYDPASGAYKRVATQPQTLTVTPAAPSTSAAGGAAPSTNDGVAGRDPGGLRPLQTRADLQAVPDVTRSLVFRVAVGLPLVVLLAAAVRWGRRGRASGRRPRRADALRRAHASLRGASQIAALPPVIYDYLSQKLGTSAAGMQTCELLAALRARGVPDADCARLAQVLAVSEQARYAPMQPPSDASLADAERLLEALERSLP